MFFVGERRCLWPHVCRESWVRLFILYDVKIESWVLCVNGRPAVYLRGPAAPAMIFESMPGACIERFDRKGWEWQGVLSVLEFSRVAGLVLVCPH